MTRMRGDTAPSIPRLCRLIDILAVGVLLLALTVFFTGGFREWTPFGRISMTSSARPLLVAIMLIVLRHWVWPRPSLASQLVGWLRRAWRAPEARHVLPVTIATRLAVLAVGFLAVATIGYRSDVDVPWRVYENEALNLPARWDTGWYLGVAIEGYRWSPAQANQQQNIAFFPAYPMLMRYGSLLLARETMWTGVLISWVSFLAAMLYLFRFARERFGADAAGAAVALLACYPFAFFFSTAYTEALFLLTIVAACYHFERRELWRAGVWGLAAGLTRPNGCLLSIVLALIALRPLWRGGSGRWRLSAPPSGWGEVARHLAVASAPGLGMLVYSAYIYSLTGHPLQWAAQNAAWGRVYRSLNGLVSQQAQTLSEHGLYSYAATSTLEALQLAAVLLVLGAVWPVARRVGVPYAVLLLVTVLPPLTMGGLLSMGRVTSVLFPMFIWLGAAVPQAHRPAWIAAFAMLQALGAALFFTWRPLY
jgi:hypothetical protein